MCRYRSAAVWRSIGVVLPVLIVAGITPFRFAFAEKVAEPQVIEIKPLRVIAAGSAPFIVDRGGRVEGLSEDVFELVAARAGLRYEVTRAESVEAAISAVVANQADVAIGPISITAARTASVAFTQPYFRSKMGIAAHAIGAGFWSRIEPFLTRAFVIGVGFLLLVLLLVGTIVWLLERRVNNEQFDETPLRGIGAGVWLALVTMTTVGYGDKAPISIGGRIVVGAWMVIAMITASSLTASIATALTLSQLDRAAIDGLVSLEGRPVAVVRGTTSRGVAARVDARVVAVDSVAEAIDRVVDERVDAALGDLPVLQYQLTQSPQLPITLVAVDERIENYGFAVPHENSALLKALDVALLELLESSKIDGAQARWLTN